MASTQLLGTAIILLVATVFGHMTWHQWKRLHWELKARESGISTHGQIVGARTIDMGSADRATYYRIRFTTTEGRLVEVEDELLGSGALEGVAVTVTYHPDQPEFAAVVGRSGQPSWVGRLLIVTVMTPLTLAVGVLLALVVVHA